MDILSKLLGGAGRVKAMRLFLLNPDQGFETKDVAERSRIGSTTARQAMNGLFAMNFVKKKTFIKEIADGRNGKIKKKRVQGWYFNPDFPYTRELKELLVEGDFLKYDDIVKRFRPAGKIQFLVVSGMFTSQQTGKLDLLLVGDNLRKSYVQKTIAILESEMGRELSYALFTVEDFKYRVSMYDKLLRDVFEYPHERLVAGKEFIGFTFPS